MKPLRTNSQQVAMNTCWVGVFCSRRWLGKAYSEVKEDSAKIMMQGLGMLIKCADHSGWESGVSAHLIFFFLCA
jgi:hypothetical protein